MSTDPQTMPLDEAERVALKGFFQRYLADPSTKFAEVTNVVRAALDDHFGVDATTLATAVEEYQTFRLVPYQLALEELLGEPGCEHRIVGVRCPSVPEHKMGTMTLARLLCQPSFAFAPPVFCPPKYVQLASGFDQMHACLRQGLVLYRDADGPAAIWLHPGPGFGYQVDIEVVAPTAERADAILDRLREATVRLAPFRGQTVRIDHTLIGPMFTYLPRPKATSRDEVILPPGLLDQIERHSLGVVNAHDALLGAGRHLKRGILLHGRPGTGKTHTIKYLTGQMPHATIVVMAAARMFDLDVFREVVEMILPAVVVLDDVDLIAEDREFAEARPGLFELLDLLDGIREDADLLFVLTTNRPNEIEPAIAARPGRVDQAVEVPLPDADCRRGLFDLYCQGLDVDMSDPERAEFLDRTDGVTAAFIREVLRRATVTSLRAGAGVAGSPPKVTGAHVKAALDTLLDLASPLTPVLLGAAPRHAIPAIDVARTK